MAKKAKKPIEKITARKAIKESCKDMGDQMISMAAREGQCIPNAISTGSLRLDLSMGGGVAPKRIAALVGPEGGGKSTILYAMMRYSVETGIPCVFYDAEGTIDRAYMENCGFNWDKFFNKLFYPMWPTTGEQVFIHMRKILRQLKSRKDGHPQAVFFIDSIPALVPQISEVDPSDQRAIIASMLSQYLPLVVTELAARHCSLIVTNQIRMNPGVQFGNPEYNPCGNSLQHYTDQRVRIAPYASGIPENKRVTGLHVSGVEKEAHVSGVGEDLYRRSRTCTVKNKAFTPMQVANMRFWFREQGGVGRGIDPVFDVVQFLADTGQLSISKGFYDVTLPGFARKFRYNDLKRTVLEPGYCGDMHGLLVYDETPVSIIDTCRAQILSGDAFELAKVAANDGKSTEELVRGEVTGVVQRENKKKKKLPPVYVIKLDDGEEIDVPIQKDTSKKDADAMIGRFVKIDRTAYVTSPAEVEAPAQEVSVTPAS